jgi:hypothetical protein
LQPTSSYEINKSESITTKNENEQRTGLNTDMPEFPNLEVLKKLPTHGSSETDESIFLLHKPLIQTKKCEILDKMNGLSIIDGYLRKNGLKLNETQKELTRKECKI